MPNILPIRTFPDRPDIEAAQNMHAIAFLLAMMGRFFDAHDCEEACFNLEAIEMLHEQVSEYVAITEPMIDEMIGAAK